MKAGWNAASGQLVRFGLVGVMNTVVTLAAIFILMEVFRLNYLLSNVCGYALGLVNSFLWNKLWTFKSNGPMLKEGAAFLIVFAVCYLVQSGALALMVEVPHVEIAGTGACDACLYRPELRRAISSFRSGPKERETGFAASDAHHGAFR